jgi:hypothetical protein
MGIEQACEEESSPAPVRRVTASKNHPGPDSLVGVARSVVWLYETVALLMLRYRLNFTGYINSAPLC